MKAPGAMTIKSMTGFARADGLIGRRELALGGALRQRPRPRHPPAAAARLRRDEAACARRSASASSRGSLTVNLNVKRSDGGTADPPQRGGAAPGCSPRSTISRSMAEMLPPAPRRCSASRACWRWSEPEESEAETHARRGDAGELGRALDRHGQRTQPRRGGASRRSCWSSSPSIETLGRARRSARRRARPRPSASASRSRSAAARHRCRLR